MVSELTISEACKSPGNFIYIWADEDNFLNLIPAKYADIIRVKKANQNKLLLNSADKFKKTVKDYTDAIRSAFIEQYGVTPYEGLVLLASGEQLPGINYKEEVENGTAGVGALFPQAFSGKHNVWVNPETGHLMLNSTIDITDDSKTVYDGGITNNNGAMPYQLFGVTSDGYTYMSQYNKTRERFYAKSYSDSAGQMYSASGSPKSGADSATIWENVILKTQTIIEWILSLFGITTKKEGEEETKKLLPNQKDDGFVFEEAGFGGAGTVLLLLAAGGALMASGALGGKKEKVK